MQSTVDPVDKEIREYDEDGKLKEIVKRERRIIGGIVHLGIASDFCNEKRCRQDSHERHRDHGLSNLKTDLVFQILGMIEGCLVKDENIRQRRKDEVDHQAKDPV